MVIASRKIGAVDPSAAGVAVIEQFTANNATTPSFGTAGLLGILKRGPMGVPIPVRDDGEYTRIFGKPGDPNWHLYKDGTSLLPDAVDGFFAEAGRNTLWLIRNELDGEGIKAKAVLYSRTNKIPVMEIIAGNEGRWGGSEIALAETPVIIVTDNTFTLVASGTKVNQFQDAIANFSQGSSSDYRIVANTAADANTGEVIFTVSSQYNLLADGVVGPSVLSGTHSYDLNAGLSGTVEALQFTNLTGTVTSNDSVLTGTGTAFSTELAVGDIIYFNSEARLIASISSDSTLTIESPFTSPLIADTIFRPNLTVTGTGTAFTTELNVGDSLIVNVGGTDYTRTVTQIISDTELELNSSFPVDVTSGTAASSENYWVSDSATGTDYGTELSVGDYIVDPNRSGSAQKVVQIDTATVPPRFRVEGQFSGNFTGVQLVKQTNTVKVALLPDPSEGLEVEIGQGVRFPATHFSLKGFFQGTEVFNAEDLSLDPNDPENLYAETTINNRNVAYREGNTIYNTWISARVLFDAAYTTSEINDVRPAISNSKIVAVETNRVYTAETFDRQIVVGRLFYPDPYNSPRNSSRIKGYVSPETFEGIVSSTGTTVAGTATTFTSNFVVGDYLYDPQTQEARKIINVVSDTQLTLESGFSSDLLLADAVAPQKAGYFSFNSGSKIETIATVGKTYFANIRVALKGGYDGDISNVTPTQWTRYFDSDLNIWERAVQGLSQGLIRIAIPGIYEPSVSRAAIAYAEQKAFIFRAEIPDYVTTAADAENFVNQQLGRNYYEVSYPSYVNINSPFGSGARLISLSGDIMGLESRFAALGSGYHRVAAGSDAILSRTISTLQSLTDNDTTLLNAAGIQPIKKQFGAYVPFGNNSPSTHPIFVKMNLKRQQSHYMRVLLEMRIVVDQIFKPIDRAMLQEINMAMDEYFRQEYRNGALTNLLSIDDSFDVNIPLIEATGNTKKDIIVSIINGEIAIFVSYTPVGVTEKVNIYVAPDLSAEAYAAAI